jgi:hypothetical protein
VRNLKWFHDGLSRLIWSSKRACTCEPPDTGTSFPAGSTASPCVPFTYPSVSLQGTVAREDFQRAVADADRLLSYATSMVQSHIIMHAVMRARERTRDWTHEKVGHSNCRVRSGG